MIVTAVASDRRSQIWTAVADAEFPGPSRRCLARSDGEPDGESLRHFGVWGLRPSAGGDREDLGDPEQPPPRAYVPGH